MIKYRNRLLVYAILAAIGWLLIGVTSVQADVGKQQPTVAVPTVTGTPLGATIRVNADMDQINVRAGPSTVGYDIVGVMIAGQLAPALGRSVGGEWIKIAYPGVPEGVGWVYSPLVQLIVGGDLPIIEPPPTTTPRVTPTIDPTAAAQFVDERPPDRLPTFTAPPPLDIPTFEPPGNPVTSSGNFLMALLIAVFGVIGILSALVSILRGGR